MRLSCTLKVALRVFILATVVGASCAATAAPGDVDTGFNPNANSAVFSTAVQPDGKTIIGGDFATVGGVTRNRIARLNADGTLDAGFDPNVGGNVYSIAVLADGKILIAGSFTTAGESARNLIARLNTDGSLDTAFNLIVDGFTPSIASIAVQADGKIIIGGSFNIVGGVARNKIARISSGGVLDEGFNPNTNQRVNSIAVQADGKIIIGGSFDTVGGVTRKIIARLNADGTLDASFNANVGQASHVNSITVQPDGKIIMAGDFNAVGGVTRNNIARLNTDGTLDAGFNPNANFLVNTATVQADGQLLIGGDFTIVGGVTRNRIARLNADGTLDTGFNPNANNTVSSIVVQADEKIIVGGKFVTLGGVTRNRIARLNADGTLDTFNPNLNGVVDSTALQVDGKVIVGGHFTTVGAVARNYIARVNTDGSLDTAFNPNASSPVYSTALQADGKIVVGGDFANVGGVPANRIARLENDAATQSLTMPNASRLQWLRGGASPETVEVTFELSTDGGGTWIPLGAGARSRLVTGWELTGLSLPGSGQVRGRARNTGGYSNCSSGLVETVAAITGLPATPDIVVEQPALTVISDAGTKAFGNVLVGSNASLTFTIRNPGTADLTGLGITLDGTNASDFTVTAGPTSPVVAAGTTTFTVQFAPAISGAKAAVLHIASNVTGSKNPYDISLTGRALAPNADDDGDGISNTTEIALASLGFDPFVNSSALLTLFQNNALGLGLYTAGDVQTLALGSPLLSKDAMTGNFHLSISIEKSPNLSGWSPLLGFSPTYDPASGKIDIEFTPDGSDAQFYRVLGAKP